MFASVLSLLLASAAVQTAQDPAAAPVEETEVETQGEAAPPPPVAVPVAPPAPAAAEAAEEEEDDPTICRRRSVENGFGKTSSQKVCKPKSVWEAQRNRR